LESIIFVTLIIKAPMMIATQPMDLRSALM
jgi:hypothetical protein